MHYIACCFLGVRKQKGIAKMLCRLEFESIADTIYIHSLRWEKSASSKETRPKQNDILSW